MVKVVIITKRSLWRQRIKIELVKRVCCVRYFHEVKFLFFLPILLCAAGTYPSYLNVPIGDSKNGEIEIVPNLEEASQISEIQKRRLLKKGFSSDDAETFAATGIVAEDSYIVWIRDAVYFPNKIPGTYDRFLWKNPGVAILPILADGRIVLNLNYRHATRSWELEIPRGAKTEGESNEDTVIRELKEETGCDVVSIKFLGEMTPDSGILSSVVPVYLGKISTFGNPEREYSEAIADILILTQEEIEKGLANGWIEVIMNHKKKRVPLRDPFLTFALYQLMLLKK